MLKQAQEAIRLILMCFPTQCFPQFKKCGSRKLRGCKNNAELGNIEISHGGAASKNAILL